MLRSILPVSGLLVLALTVACGGATPAPSDESQASSKSGDDKAASAAAPAESAAVASTQAPEPAAAPATTQAAPAPAAAPASGDIKAPAGDDPWLASHQMSPKDVVRTMRAAQGKVQACFKAGVKRDPSTNGEVKIRFVVTNDGAVRAWKDDASSMTDGEVTQCVGEVLNKLKFPKQKSPGDAWGVYSIHFGN